MSRTIKGSKPPMYDFWSRRAGNESCCNCHGAIVKKITHRKERMQSKRIVREQTK